MRYIKRLCAALAAAMLITLVGCNAAVTSPAHTDDVLVAVPERTHTPEPVLTPAPIAEEPTAAPVITGEPTPSPTPDDGLPYYSPLPYMKRTKTANIPRYSEHTA